jgi:CO/xanthine dehydrogenase Mo-binding subunit
MAKTNSNKQAAAVANAVFDATGVRLTSLPISCEKVYEGLQQKR